MLYHWQAQGLEMFVAADNAPAAHRAIVAKLSAHSWENPPRYELALIDIRADHVPFTELGVGHVLMLDCGTWKAPQSK